MNIRQLLLTVCITALPLSATADGLIRYVDPFVGTGARPNAFLGGDSQLGQTIPAVLVPNGMNFWTPQTEGTELKCVSPYYYSNPRIQGFRNSHWIVGGCTQDYGSVTIMPLIGELKTQPEERASAIRHEDETARPDYYAVPLFGGDIRAEMTGTSRTGIFRFTFRKAGTAYLVITPNSDEAQGSVSVDAARGEVTGSNPVHRIYQGFGEPAGFTGYFQVLTRKKIDRYGVYDADGVISGKADLSARKAMGAWIAFHVEAGEEMIVKVASSFCDVMGARQNMAAECPGWDFDAVCRALTATWEQRLGAITVESHDTTALQKFYTALYHASFLPHAINDADGRYPSFAGGKSICHTDGNYYDDYSMWDTYRALHPLLSILYPEQTGEMIQSLVDKYEQGGWLPIFPCWNSYTSEMIGDHCASLIADAWLKGIRNFDIAKAYTALRKNAFNQPKSYQAYCDGKGRRALTSYIRYGYIPLEDSVKEAFHQGEQVSRTLEYAYDDFALAQLARALGHRSDADTLYRRARNYRNVIDPHTGYAQGRHADGSFLTADNAFTACPFITEGYPCHYTWYVPHNIYGLMHCMGGKRHYAAKLDSMFSEKRYWHGNEPCHQVAYLFNYAGEPWKTQRWVRHIMQTEYRTGSDGLSGNDDAGQMSAWYVFSSLGFYPVCPASGYYVIGSPSFTSAVIRLPDDKRFIIRAANASAENIYIQSARLNGRNYDLNYLLHADIARGGVLEVVMGNRPNTHWGSSARSCPPKQMK